MSDERRETCEADTWEEQSERIAAGTARLHDWKVRVDDNGQPLRWNQINYKLICSYCGELGAGQPSSIGDQP